MSIRFLFIIFLFLTIWSCRHEQVDLPDIPLEAPQAGEIQYVQLNPVLDRNNGYDFKKPSDIYYGVDNFLYIADTDNDRIVMIDLAGAVQGISQPIPHPQAITQNDSMQLLVVNKTNKVFRIDMVKNDHLLENAGVEVVYEEVSEPSRQFTGITVHNGFEYYVTVIDTTDSPVLSQIYDFYPNHTKKGPLPLYVNGTGLYSALLPTGIVSVRERYLDVSSRLEDSPAFLFCQTGSIPEANLFNFYKVQYITTTTFEGQEVLTPKTDLLGTPQEDYIYYYDKFYNPEDIALDYSGNMFVIDRGEGTENGRAPGFYRFGPTGRESHSIVGFGSDDYQFRRPEGIAVSPDRTLQTVYIADTGNDRVLMFQLSNEF